MKKVILMMVVAVFCIATANAQLNVGANIGTQISTEDDGSTGFGFGVNAEYLIMPNIGLGANIGYYIMDREKEDGVTTTVYIMPFTLTGKYYFLTDNFRPYAGVDLGLYTLGVRSSGKEDGFSFSASYSDTKFGLGPVAGFQFGLSDNLALDVNAKYSHVFVEGESTGFVGINAGIVYKFNFGK